MLKDQFLQERLEGEQQRSRFVREPRLSQSVFSVCALSLPWLKAGMALSPGVLAFSPAHARVPGEVLLQAWLLPRMCCLYWALIPALLMTECPWQS